MKVDHYEFVYRMFPNKIHRLTKVLIPHIDISVIKWQELQNSKKHGHVIVHCVHQATPTNELSISWMLLKEEGEEIIEFIKETEILFL